MPDDPIVEEVRRTRRRLLAQCGGKIEDWIAHLQAKEAKEQGRVVSSLEEARAQQTDTVSRGKTAIEPAAA